MSTINNWVKNNLRDRFNDPACDFTVSIDPYPFQPMNFDAAADFTARLISDKHSNIFLGLSGGADSDFVLHCFIRNNIKVTPIIVVTSGNKIEREYAFYSCRKFNLTPLIIELSDKELLTIYEHELIDKINAIGLDSIPGVVACRYAKENNGVFIQSEYFINPEDSTINEWDFYNEVLVGEQHNIPFFFYTVELCYAFTSSIEPMPTAEWKAKLYNLPFRPKINYEYSYHFKAIQTKICAKRHKNNKIIPNPSTTLGDKIQLLNLLTPFIKNL